MYHDEYGLIVDTPNAIERENSLLWTAQSFYLTRKSETFVSLSNAIERCRIAPGLYEQHPSHNLKGDDRFMSHDQLTAIVAFSHEQGLYHHKDIWQEIKRQRLTYNNLQDGRLRLLHPRDLCYYGYLCGSWLTKILVFLPLLFFLFISVKKYKIIDGRKIAKTDDELLNFVRFAALRKDSKLWEFIWSQYYKKVQREHGSYNVVFKIYFKAENHPNVYDSREI